VEQPITPENKRMNISNIFLSDLSEFDREYIENAIANKRYPMEVPNKIIVVVLIVFILNTPAIFFALLGARFHS
jgi:hypothetical protein